MTEVDIPLLRKVVEWVDEQDKIPEIDREWLQRTWHAASHDHALHLASHLPNVDYDLVRSLADVLQPHCGTAYCAAGYVAHLDGMLKDNDNAFVSQPDHPDADDDGEISISQYAKERLGLTETQAAAMFNGANTAAQVRHYAEKAAGERL